MRYINFKKLSREMNVPTSTNNERINAKYKGTELSVEHYKRLMNQKEVYNHPKLPIALVITNKNKTIKLIDKIRCVELRIFNGNKYNYCVFDGSCVSTHKLVAECYNNKLIEDGYDIHHKDKDKHNYRPENLAILTIEEHQAIHRNEVAVNE